MAAFPSLNLLVLLFYTCLLQCAWALVASGDQSFRGLLRHNDLVAPQISIQHPGVPGPESAHNAPPPARVQVDGSEIGKSKSKLPSALQAVLDAIEVMQTQYFDLFTGTWPSAIDWTAAVIGTHVSATLSSLVSSFEISSSTTCSDVLEWQNIVDRYFAQTSVFYFGENAFSIRNQAYDDMLWVVLGWLETVKFVEIYTLKHWYAAKSMKQPTHGWHGLQFSPLAAHRARIFYELASEGWDTALCGGGMTWNPRLTPYKNAITNELFISASISMYLYYPGDNNTSPYFLPTYESSGKFTKPHHPSHLANAIKAYQWLQKSQMQDPETGLYRDGFHITDWHRFPNGTEDPGTGNCDELNSMVYTYNQGTLLTAHRGLWMSTGTRAYLDDGHKLVDNVIRATGWLDNDRSWHGLGRGGVMEEFCDHGVCCSQNGQTFKGIFFHHLAEFCRPLWGYEKEFMDARTLGGFDKGVYRYHQARCAAYSAWIRHNARAMSVTKDEAGRFGMWWGRQYPDATPVERAEMELADGAVDYMNDGVPGEWILPRQDDGSARSSGSERQPYMQMQSEDINDHGRGRTVETQSGGLAVLRAHWQWESMLNEA